LIALLVIIGIVVFVLAAVRFGADSRDLHVSGTHHVTGEYRG